MQINDHLPDIVQLIADSTVTTVIAPTGSGKSIGIPAAVGQTGASIFISVPTITAAKSLYTRQMLISKGLNIGYAAEGDIHYDKNTQIIYATSGHLRRKMLSYFTKGKAKNIDFTDILMIDEVHSGSLDNSINIDLWKNAAAQGVLVPRLLLSSATLEMSIFTGKPVIFGLFENLITPALYEIKIPSYAIEKRYYHRDFDIDDSELYVAAAKLVSEIHTTNDDGAMLVFAPGKKEVETLINLIAKYKLKNAKVIPAYGALSSEEIAEIYKPVPKGTRKIIIATNVAESAITIDDLAFVLDTMLEKHTETSESGGFRLVLSRISQGSAEQRCGRTGRTRQGYCYRLMTSSTYDTLIKQRPPEIQRIPLYNVIMELLNVGLMPEKVLSEVSAQRINESIDLLARLNLIDKNTRLPTAAGKFVSQFPLSVKNATVLWRCTQLKNGGSSLPVFPFIVVVSLIDCYGPSYFYFPRKTTDQSLSDYRQMLGEHQRKYFDKYRGRSDVDTLVEIWNNLMASVGGISVGRKELLQWCQDNSMNHQKIKEVIKIVRACTLKCSQLKHKCQAGPFTREGVMKYIRPVFSDVYSDMTMRTKKNGSNIVFSHGGVKGIGITPLQSKDYLMDRNSFNTFREDPPIFIVSLLTHEYSSRGTINRISVISLDIETPTGFPTNETELPQTKLPRAKPTQKESAPSTDERKKLQEALDLIANLDNI